MNQTESTAAPARGISGALGRFFRFIAFVCTSGFAFPHVCTEGMDLTKIQNEHEGKDTEKH